MYELLILRCKDPLKWYSDKIGERVPLVALSVDSKEYKSREPAGFTNFVSVSDAIVVYDYAAISQYLGHDNVEQMWDEIHSIPKADSLEVGRYSEYVELDTDAGWTPFGLVMGLPVATDDEFFAWTDTNIVPFGSLTMTRDVQRKSENKIMMETAQNMIVAVEIVVRALMKADACSKQE